MTTQTKTAHTGTSFKELSDRLLLASRRDQEGNLVVYLFEAQEALQECRNVLEAADNLIHKGIGELRMAIQKARGGR